MRETIPLSQRRIDIVLIAFFLVNLLFVSYFIDTEQLVIAANASWIIFPLILLFRMRLNEHPFTRPAVSAQTSEVAA